MCEVSGGVVRKRKVGEVRQVERERRDDEVYDEVERGNEKSFSEK